MSELVIKVGNPIFKDDTSEDAIKKYNALKTFIATIGGLEIVELWPDKLKIVAKSSKTIKYPKNADYDWLLSTIVKTCNTLDVKSVFRKYSRVHDFFKLAERIVKDGGYCIVHDDKITLRRGTFNAT